MRRQRRFFSILEILLAVTLLVGMGSVFAIKTYRAVQEARYTADVRCVASLLQTAQNMAVVKKGSVEVHFQWNTGLLTMRCIPLVEYPLALGKKFLERDFPLRGIRTLYHNGERLSPGEEWVVKFNRFDGAFRRPGLFSFGEGRDDTEEECTYRIFLETYPAPIRAVRRVPVRAEMMELAEESERLYPREVWEMDDESV